MARDTARFGVQILILWFVCHFIWPGDFGVGDLLWIGVFSLALSIFYHGIGQLWQLRTPNRPDGQE